MARRLIWSKEAKISRANILDYWKKRNKSKEYSKKLNSLFTKGVQQIEEYPYSGVEIANNVYRGKLIKDYYIIYSITVEHIAILLIWDTRQNPEKLQNILGL